MKNIFGIAIGFLICCNLLVSMEEQKNQHLLKEKKSFSQTAHAKKAQQKKEYVKQAKAVNTKNFRAAAITMAVLAMAAPTAAGLIDEIPYKECDYECSRKGLHIPPYPAKDPNCRKNCLEGYNKCFASDLNLFPEVKAQRAEQCTYHQIGNKTHPRELRMQNNWFQ